MRPKPVTKPSPAGRCFSIPKSTQRWRTNLSSSSKVPSSRRRSIRSRAVNLPALCSRSRRSAPPPASAWALRRRGSSIRSLCFAAAAEAEDFVSDKRRSGIDGFVVVEDADGEMGGEPGCAEEKDDAEDEFGGYGDGALSGGWDGCDIHGRADESEHGGEGHRDDQSDRDNGGDDFFHGEEMALRGLRRTQKDSAGGGKNEWRDSLRCPGKKEKADFWHCIHPGKLGRSSAAPLHEARRRSRWRISRLGLAEAGPVVGDDNGVGGVGGVVLDASGLAGDEAFEFDLAFEAGDVLGGVIGHAGDCVAVGNQVARAIVDDGSSARTEQTFLFLRLFGRVLDDVDDLAFGDAADLIELKATLTLEVFGWFRGPKERVGNNCDRGDGGHSHTQRNFQISE